MTETLQASVRLACYLTVEIVKPVKDILRGFTGR